MTVEVDTAGPGTEAWRSGTYAATVDGSTAFVYGKTRGQVMGGHIYTTGEDREESWLRYGADQATTVVVTMVDESDITSAIVYPGDQGVEQSIADGALTLTVPDNVRVRVEINGNRATPLHLIANPPKPAVPSTTTSFADLTLTVTAVSTDDSTFTVPGHSFSVNDRVIVHSTGTLPGASGGSLDPYEAVSITGVEGDAVTLASIGEGGAAITVTSEGTGTITMAPASYGSSTPLYFPAGEHAIGRHFDITADNVSVYFDYGAVVTGSFDIQDTDYFVLQGPGVFCGDFADRDALPYVSGDSELYEYLMIRGLSTEVGTSAARFALVSDVVIVNSPFHLLDWGVRGFARCTLLSAWYWNTDGFHAVTGSSQYVTNCYTNCGDDAFVFQAQNLNVTYSGNFAVTAGGSCYRGRFFSNSTGGTVSLTDNHAMHVGYGDGYNSPTQPPFGGRCIFNSLTDGNEDQLGQGHANVTIDGLKVWGPAHSGRLFVLGNAPYPWSSQIASRDQVGEIFNWTIRDVWVDNAPAKVSRLVSKDAQNTPHDITFENIVIGGTTVTVANFSTFVEVDSYCYNITWPATDISTGVTEPPTSGGGSGSGSETPVDDSTANSYASIAYLDAYFTDHSAPVAWQSATTAQKANALREATSYLDDTYGGRWRGVRSTVTQSLEWPRAGVQDGDNPDLLYADDVIPVRLKQACCELALRVLQGTDLQPDVSAGGGGIATSSISLSGLSVNKTYHGTKSTQPKFPRVDAKLRGLLQYGGSGVVRRVTR